MFSRYYVDSDVFNRFKYSSTRWCVIRRERVKDVHVVFFLFSPLITLYYVHKYLKHAVPRFKFRMDVSWVLTVKTNTEELTFSQISSCFMIFRSGSFDMIMIWISYLEQGLCLLISYFHGIPFWYITIRACEEHVFRVCIRWTPMKTCLLWCDYRSNTVFDRLWLAGRVYCMKTVSDR